MWCKCDDLLLVTLKWDLPTVCLTIFGVTLLIFHFNSRLCSAGSSSTAEHTTQKLFVIYDQMFLKLLHIMSTQTTGMMHISKQFTAPTINM